MTLRELLNKDPEPKDVMLRNGAEYLPIGIVETYLDTFDVWSAKNFSFKKDSESSYSGIITLEIHHGSDFISMNGSCTYHVDPTNENTNHVATLESYCIANAAKRMGRRFGRHLNNRMLGSEESGNTIPEIQVDKPEEPTDLTSYTKNLNLPNVGN